MESYYSALFGGANIVARSYGEEFIYDDGWGKKSVATQNADFVFRNGLAFSKTFSCGNYRTPAESPYGYGAHVVNGPVKVFAGEGILCDYDDRLRGFYRDKWQGACEQLKGKRLKHAPLSTISAFLSHLYEFDVKALQVIEGCNVSNGYPYLIFVSKRCATPPENHND